jgi:hypothetical protein
MTLTQLRAMVRDLIFDKAPQADPFGTDGLNRFINAALHEVCHVARGLQRSLFVTSQTVLVNGGVSLAVAVPLTAPYTQVKRLLFAWAKTEPVGPVAVKNLAQAGLDLQPAGSPALTVVNDGLLLLNPPGVLQVELWYVAGLPEMTADANTPGQTGDPSTGTANLLPADYHPLIAIKAAVLALKAERGEWQGLQAEYDEQVRALAAAIAGQDDTSENG